MISVLNEIQWKTREFKSNASSNPTRYCTCCISNIESLSFNFNFLEYVDKESFDFSNFFYEKQIVSAICERTFCNVQLCFTVSIEIKLRMQAFETRSFENSMHISIKKKIGQTACASPVARVILLGMLGMRAGLRANYAHKKWVKLNEEEEGDDSGGGGNNDHELKHVTNYWNRSS